MTIAWRADSFRAANGWSAAWRRHAAILGGVWAALLVMFGGDVVDLAEIYWNSTTFGHCLFVSPILAWLVCRGAKG